MCRWFENKIKEKRTFLNDVWFSDEGPFLLSGHINTKNNVFWGTQTPDKGPQRDFHSVICRHIVVMSKRGIIRLLWFEDADGEAVTVTKKVLHCGA